MEESMGLGVYLRPTVGRPRSQGAGVCMAHRWGFSELLEALLLGPPFPAIWRRWAGVPCVAGVICSLVRQGAPSPLLSLC